MNKHGKRKSTQHTQFQGHNKRLLPDSSNEPS